MKQKYVILRSEDKTELIIREFAELDKDSMSLLCEETYNIKAIETAVNNGKEALIGALRTPNMYPARICAEKIADSVMTLYESADQESAEVFFDDFDFIAPKKKAAAVEETAGETTEIENLMEDEFDDSYNEKPSVNKLNASLNVDEDDLSDFEEES